MARHRRHLAVICGAALALIMAASYVRADEAGANATLSKEAVAFVQTVARRQFDAAETNFSEQMKSAAPPAKLEMLWSTLVNEGGTYIGTGKTKLVVRQGYRTVVVRTEFKNQAIGFAVTFDGDGRIAGLHLVQAP